MPAWAGQERYGLRFQWGPLVAATLAEGVCVVVDVLRFTTAVEAAVTGGVAVYPYRWRDATAAAFAASVPALLANLTRTTRIPRQIWALLWLAGTVLAVAIGGKWLVLRS